MHARRIFAPAVASALIASLVLPVEEPPASAISQLDSINVGDGPAAMTLNHEGTIAFTANTFDDTVTAINLATQTTTTISVGDQPSDVQMRPGRNELWVANYGSGTISVINTITLQETEFFATSGAPNDIVFLPDGTRAYVTLPFDDTVRAFNATTKDIITSWSVGDQPTGIAFDRNRDRLIVTASGNNAGGNRINFIALGTDVVTSLTLQNGPGDVIVDEERDQAYVSMFFSGTVARVDLTNDSLLGYLGVASQPQGMSVSFDNELLLVAFSSQVTVISLDEWTQGASWTTLSSTSDVVMAPDGRTVYSSSLIDDSVQVAQLEIDRLSGTDRYKTAIALSQEAYPGTHDVAYLASGTSFADALSLAPAVGVQNGPLLLNPQSTLRADVLAEIQRLDPNVVYIAGGPSVISNTVRSQIEATGAAVIRLEGANRFETSLSVIDEFFSPGVPVFDDLFLVTGRNFPDALSAGAAAAARTSPMILVDGNASSLPAAVISRITSLDPDRVIVVGGTSVMSQGIQNQLVALGGPEIVRAAGTDRYATSVAVNATAFRGYTSPASYWATGANFPDALAGVTVSAPQQGPLYLVRPTCVPPGVISGVWRFGADRIGILGGPSVVSTAVENFVRC